MSNKPKRFTETFDGMEVEYGLEPISLAKLFGLEKEAKKMPYLNMRVPRRVYYVPKSDAPFLHPLVPRVKKNYEFEVNDVLHLIPYLLSGRGSVPYLFGLHGTGKSSANEQACARLGLPCVNVILGEDSEVIDLGGQMLPTKTGGMEFFYGLLAQAMSNGWVLQFDEYDLLPTRQQKMLNEVMENRRFTIETTGERIVAHKDWRCVLTANTNNTGSGSVTFVSGGSGDASVNDRFQMIEKHYLPEETEKRILNNHAKQLLMQIENRSKQLHQAILGGVSTDLYLGAFSNLIDLMYSVASSIRKAHAESRKSTTSATTLDCSMSIRSLERWIEKVFDYSSFYNGVSDIDKLEHLYQAFLVAFVNGISTDEQEIVKQIFTDITDYKAEKKAA